MSTPELFSTGGSRSMGVKLLLICGLALLMTIPAIFIAGLVQDRTQRAANVEDDIAAQVGGAQTFLGPTLAVPYSKPPAFDGGPEQHGVWLIAPAQASGTIRTTTEERHRSLFRVPVFQADLKLNSQFDLTEGLHAMPADARADWSRAEIVIGAADVRGALTDATITADGKSVAAVPAEVTPELCFGANERKRPKLTMLGAPAGAAVRPGAQFSVSAALRFSGARRLAVIAYGKTTQIEMQGDWPSPGFDGSFLPARRTVSDSGFQAHWSVPFIARGVRAEGTCESMSTVESASFGVSFIEMANAYQSVSRALKYSLLFVSLVFLTFFTLESTSGKRLHAAQYVLVGLAQMIFYLLLLSFSERVGFDTGFLLAGAATVALLAMDVRWVFMSNGQSVRSLAVFTTLYALMYGLLRLEDNALLMGAIASFLAVAAVMYLTRNIDWYGMSSGPASGHVQDRPV